MASPPVADQKAVERGQGPAQAAWASASTTALEELGQDRSQVRWRACLEALAASRERGGGPALTAAAWGHCRAIDGHWRRRRTHAVELRHSCVGVLRPMPPPGGVASRREGVSHRQGDHYFWVRAGSLCADNLLRLGGKRRLIKFCADASVEPGNCRNLLVDRRRSWPNGLVIASGKPIDGATLCRRPVSRCLFPRPACLRRDGRLGCASAVGGVVEPAPQFGHNRRQRRACRAD